MSVNPFSNNMGQQYNPYPYHHYPMFTPSPHLNNSPANPHAGYHMQNQVVPLPFGDSRNNPLYQSPNNNRDHLLHNYDERLQLNEMQRNDIDNDMIRKASGSSSSKRLSNDGDKSPKKTKEQAKFPYSEKAFTKNVSSSQRGARLDPNGL